MDQKLAERVRKELGEGANPAYIELLLKMNTYNLIVWMREHCVDMQKPIVETASLYSERKGRRRDKNVLLLGVNIMESNLKRMLFVLAEVKSRIEAGRD